MNWRILVIVLGALWSDLPALGGGWVSDDSLEVAANPDLRSVGGLARIWSGAGGADYLPLKGTVEWIGWHLWHGHPAGYHLLNLGLHVLAAGLLWTVLRRLGLAGAWIAALVFALHPVAAESVAWVSELKNTLSLALLLLAFLWYLEWEGRPGAARPFYPASLGAFALALLSKGSVVMLPGVLLLHAWWKHGRISRRHFLAALPYAALSLVCGLVTVRFQEHRAARDLVFAPPGAWSRIAAAGVSAGFYLSKIVAPLRLSFIYPRWGFAGFSPLQLLPWIVFAGLFAWLLARRERAGVFLLGWFLLNLGPVLGFIPMAYGRFSWVADHFAYLPMIGVIALGAMVARKWATALRDLGTRWRAAPAAAGAAAVVCLSLAARRASARFQDERSLWTSTLQVNPAAPAAHNNLGLVLLKDGLLGDAKDQFTEALRLDPGNPEARTNLGVALYTGGEAEEAVAQFQAALGLDPTYAEAHNDLASAFRAEGDLPGAIREYRLALKWKPDYAEAAYNLGLCLSESGRPADAIAAYQAALRIDPDLAEARNNLGVALAHAGRYGEAIAEYRRALALNPGYPEAENNLGLALAKSGRLAEAARHFQAALRLRPDYADARHNFEVAERELGQ